MFYLTDIWRKWVFIVGPDRLLLLYLFPFNLCCQLATVFLTISYVIYVNYEFFDREPLWFTYHPSCHAVSQCPSRRLRKLSNMLVAVSQLNAETFLKGSMPHSSHSITAAFLAVASMADSSCQFMLPISCSVKPFQSAYAHKAAIQTVQHKRKAHGRKVFATATSSNNFS